MILRFLSVIVISSIFLVGCSEYEREKILNEIKVATMSEKEKLRMKRLEVLERQVELEAKKLVIDYLNSKSESYTSVEIPYYVIDKESSYTHPMHPNKVGYTANFKAMVYNENFLAIKTTEIDAPIDFYFDKDTTSLGYEIGTYRPDWIVSGSNIRSTGNGEKAVEMIGDFINNK